jgi:non-haem Fe2+, alpha-ketoglutarate-dependent halogenase
MKKTLSAEQIAGYKRDGVTFPVPALSTGEIIALQRTFEELERLLDGDSISARLSQPHLHFRWAYDLATHSKIQDAVEDLIGPDILVHSSTIFCKEARSPGYVSWHQDGYYWRLSDTKLTSAWIALTDSTVENGCLRVVIGSHAAALPHFELRTEHNMLSTGLHLTEDVALSQVQDVALKAGEMSLHHVNLVHGSNANRSDTRRLGYAVRYVAPSVKQVRKHHAVVLARGQDRHGHFKMFEGTPPGALQDGIRASVAFDQSFNE